MPAQFLDSPVPRYAQLADLMRQRIARGAWPQEHRIPSLETLMEEFGVARVTVRQAIDLPGGDPYCALGLPDAVERVRNQPRA